MSASHCGHGRNLTSEMICTPAGMVRDTLFSVSRSACVETQPRSVAAEELLGCNATRPHEKSFARVAIIRASSVISVVGRGNGVGAGAGAGAGVPPASLTTKATSVLAEKA